MSFPSDSPILIGIPHRALRDVEMLIYDYDQVAVQTALLSAGSIFQPWEPAEHWRGEKVPITLGSQNTEFDWGVSAGEGHFLRWDDFFSVCEPVEGAGNGPLFSNECEGGEPQSNQTGAQDQAEQLSQTFAPASAKAHRIWKTREGNLLLEGEVHPIYLAVSGQGIRLPNGAVIHEAAEYFEITASGALVTEFSGPWTSTLEDDLYVSGIHVVIENALYRFFYSMRGWREPTLEQKLCLRDLVPLDHSDPSERIGSAPVARRAGK
jgi:hypothetical protein